VLKRALFCSIAKQQLVLVRHDDIVVELNSPALAAVDGASALTAPPRSAVPVRQQARSLLLDLACLLARRAIAVPARRRRAPGRHRLDRMDISFPSRRPVWLDTTFRSCAAQGEAANQADTDGTAAYAQPGDHVCIPALDAVDHRCVDYEGLFPARLWCQPRISRLTRSTGPCSFFQPNHAQR
jgi:hypothetical protein